MQNRTKELTAVPLVYNSESDSYTIGTLTVTQKDIETKTDADWVSLIEQAKSIKIAMDSLKSEQDANISAQEKEIADLKAKLELLLKATNVVNTVSEVSTTILNAVTGSDLEVPKINVPAEVLESPFEPKQTISIAHGPIDQPKPIAGYVLPNSENKLLNDFDLMHAEVLEEPGFLLKREGYIQCQKDVAKELHRIFYEIDPAIQKSVEIKKLYESWQ